VRSGIAKWVYRYISQTTCPWNVKYATLLPAGSPFAPREALAGKDAPQLARELLGMSQDEFVGAFKGSPMKRAKLRGLKRNAAVVLGNVGSEVDVDVLTRALDDPDPLVREHAAWALRRLRAHEPTAR
jgi:epoxyqueuosine reductase